MNCYNMLLAYLFFRCSNTGIFILQSTISSPVFMTDVFLEWRGADGCLNSGLVGFRVLNLGAPASRKIRYILCTKITS